MARVAWIETALALLLAPLLAGVIARVKARVAGRRGQPLTQLYSDLLKLLRKGAVYSETTTWVFRAGPLVTLAASVAALVLLPYGDRPALVAFAGDFVLLAALLSLARFFTVAAALDTGSSFEAMGASREVHFAALAEPTRRSIIEMLAAQGQLSATAISRKFRVSPPAISQHLKVLREARLVRMEKHAQQRIYAINTEAMGELEEWARKMAAEWDKRFDALEKLAQAEEQKTPKSPLKALKHKGH